MGASRLCGFEQAGGAVKENPKGVEETSLSLAVTEDDDKAVLHVEGEVDLGTSPAFRSALVTLAQRNPTSLVVDLSGVQFMDSSGLHALLEVAERLRGRGGRVVLRRPAEILIRMLQYSGTVSQFVIEA